MGKGKVIKGSVKVGKNKRGIVWLSRPSTMSIIFLVFGMILMGFALTLAGVPVIWMVWYRLSPNTSQALAQVLMRPVGAAAETSVNQLSVYQPQLDQNLPLEKRLIIPKMGVNTLIQEAPLYDYETALKLGVWRVPDFGDPYNRQKPTILAAHRFGYLAWSVKYRLANSFYNFPKLKVGDQIEIDWLQRRYIYEVYAASEGKEITDYTADLILYTCKFLESPVRLFAYARLVEK